LLWVIGKATRMAGGWPRQCILAVMFILLMSGGAHAQVYIGPPQEDHGYRQDQRRYHDHDQGYYRDHDRDRYYHGDDYDHRYHLHRNCAYVAGVRVCQ